MIKIPSSPLNIRPVSKPGTANFSGKLKSGISSIAHQTPTSNFHQFGDAVSHTSGGDRSGKIFGSINSAIKNKNNPTTARPLNNPNSPTSQNFKPLIK
jgi:hypothetical protein